MSTEARLLRYRKRRYRYQHPYMTAIDSKVWARLPPDQYIFFFRKIYAGEKGQKQELIAKFFAALYEECLRQGVKGEWDPYGYAVINDLMTNLNFNAERRSAIDPSPKRKKKSYIVTDDS